MVQSPLQISAFIVLQPGLDMYLLSIIIILVALIFFSALSHIGKKRMHEFETKERKRTVKRNSIADSATELNAIVTGPRFSLAWNKDYRLMLYSLLRICVFLQIDRLSRDLQREIAWVYEIIINV